MGSGHRDRMKKRFLEKGIYSFNDYEMLEILLYNVVIRRNTTTIAKNLIKTFGGLEGVFRASFDELKSVEGIGITAAVYIKFIGEFKSRMIIDNENRKRSLSNSTEVGKYCCEIFNCLGFERFVLLSLRADRTLISCDIVCDGNDNAVLVDIREVVKFAIRNKASAVILAHNHPGDTTHPSANDISITNRISVVLDALGIPVLDHIICSGDIYTSMSERGLMDN